MAGPGAGNLPQLRALFVAAVVVGALSLAPPVRATNFSGATGLTGCEYNNKADSAAHGFFYVSMSPRNASATDWARTYVLDPTDVNTYSDANTSTTDVLVHDGYYSTLCGLTWFHPSTGSGVVGLAICGSLSGSACEQFRVYYNQYFTDIADLTDVRGLATHEAGHTLGLLHRTGNTAMQTGYPKPCLCFDPNHEVLHLNSAY